MTTHENGDQTVSDERDLKSHQIMELSRAIERIVAEATDLCWKATPFTEDESGAISAYLLPAGVVHRLLGALQGAGYPAAFRAIAAPDDPQ